MALITRNSSNSKLRTFIDQDIVGETEVGSLSTCDKVVRGAVRIATFGTMVGLTSLDVYNKPTANFCNRVVPSIQSGATPVLEITGGLSYSSLFAVAATNLMLNPILSPTEEKILSPKETKNRDSILKVVATAIGVLGLFPAYIGKNESALSQSVQVVTQAGLFASSANDFLKLIAESLQSADNNPLDAVKLFCRSIQSSFSPVRVKQDKDFNQRIHRQQLAKRLNSNLIYLSRAPEKQKKEISFQLQSAKNEGDWLKAALVQLDPNEGTKSAITAHYTILAVTGFFACAQLYLMHSIATKQLNSVVQDEVSSNLLGTLSALTVAPAIFNFTRNTVHGLVTTPLRIYNGTWGAATIGDQVGPGFAKHLKTIGAICASLAWANNIQTSYEMGYPEFWQSVMAMASILLVFSPTNDAIESAGKFLIASKNPASIANEEKKQALETKQLLVKTEKDFQRFLDVVKQCDSDELKDLVCSSPTNSRSSQETTDPTLPLLNGSLQNTSSEERAV